VPRGAGDRRGAVQAVYHSAETRTGARLGRNANTRNKEPRMSRASSKVVPLILAACTAALLHAPEANAQMSSARVPAGLTPEKIAQAFPNLAGIGAGVAPDYLGSDDYTPVAAPGLFYRFGDTNRNVQWWGTYGMVSLIDSPTWSAGPLLQFRPGRKDVDDAVVSRMSEIDNSWEAGVFVGYQYINAQGIPWIARVNGGAQWNLNDEYDGTYWWASGSFLFPLREDIFVGIGGGFGGGFGGGDRSFNQIYFGVTPGNAAASGLPVYSPGSGISTVYVWPAVIWRFHPNWIAGAGGMYTRITGDGADSPVVRDRGSANQWIGGVGIAYAWN
jgi:outer membrane protein